MAELRLIRDHFYLCDEIKLDAVPDCLGNYTDWQYGSESHAIAARNILSSVILMTRSDNSLDVNIRYLVLNGWSQWVIVKNVAKHANILQAELNIVEFFVGGIHGCFFVFKNWFRSHIPLAVFSSEIAKETASACLNGTVSDNSSWKITKAIMDQVHRNVCSHANFTDMCFLLHRNRTWSDMVTNHVGWLVESCVACRSAATSQPSRKLKIPSLSRNFYKVVCIHRFYLDSEWIFSCMDIATRYSTAPSFSSASVEQAITGFEFSWLSQFWKPGAVQADSPFRETSFTNIFWCSLC